MRIHRFSVSFWLVIATAYLVTSAVPALGQDTNAQCTLQFDATWSAQTHPIDFPSSAHFSPLIGATHDLGTDFWQIAGFASPGIQTVAETGGTTLFRDEIQLAIDLGSAQNLIAGGGIAVSPGATQVGFEASLTHSLLTMVTMIAPSPDWFVGVGAIDLLSGGSWRPTTTVDLAPYDAGTDSGETFSSPNDPTIPAEPIFEITQSPFPNGVPLGTFTITCDSALLFFDDFESGDFGLWSGVS